MGGTATGKGGRETRLKGRVREKKKAFDKNGKKKSTGPGEKGCTDDNLRRY